MKALQYILYGIILGHFLTRSWSKLRCDTPKGRYVVLADHCAYKDVYYLVGTVDTSAQLDLVYDAIDRSTFFDPVIYDTTVASQREELKGIFVNDFDTLTVDERIDLADARDLCIH